MSAIDFKVQFIPGGKYRRFCLPAEITRENFLKIIATRQDFLGCLTTINLSYIDEDTDPILIETDADWEEGKRIHIRYNNFCSQNNQVPSAFKILAYFPQNLEVRRNFEQTKIEETSIYPVVEATIDIKDVNPSLTEGTENVVESHTENNNESEHDTQSDQLETSQSESISECYIKSGLGDSFVCLDTENTRTETIEITPPISSANEERDTQHIQEDQQTSENKEVAKINEEIMAAETEEIETKLKTDAEIEVPTNVVIDHQPEVDQQESQNSTPTTLESANETNGAAFNIFSGYKYKQELVTLREMGFNNIVLCVQLLHKHQGNVNAVVEEYLVNVNDFAL